MGEDTFDVLILIGRPASGKSEILDLLMRTSPEDRRRRFHIADVDVLDDFPMLWTWFEEDHILSERLGQPRLHTDADGYFRYPYLWHLLIERLSLEYGKQLRDDPAFHDHTTTIVEFSRGSEHGGYAGAFPHLAKDLLRRAAVSEDQAERMDLFRRAEAIAVVQEAANLPLYTYIEHYMIRPRVHGAWPNQMGYMLLKQVWVDR